MQFCISTKKHHKRSQSATLHFLREAKMLQHTTFLCFHSKWGVPHQTWPAGSMSCIPVVSVARHRNMYMQQLCNWSNYCFITTCAIINEHYIHMQPQWQRVPFATFSPRNTARFPRNWTLTITNVSQLLSSNHRLLQTTASFLFKHTSHLQRPPPSTLPLTSLRP